LTEGGGASSGNEKNPVLTERKTGFYANKENPSSLA
jgi:hypothetical protein